MVQKRQVKEESGKKDRYFSKLGDTFRATKFDKKRYWKTFFIDLVYSIIIGSILVGIFYYGFSYIKANPEIFNNIQTLQSLEGVEDASQVWPLLLPFITVIIGFGAIFMLARFFIGSAFKGWIWRRIMRKKMNSRFYFKYLGFKFITGAVILVVFISAMFMNLLGVLLLIGTILLIHLFTVSLIYFAKEGFIWQSIKKGFKKGIKIHLFLIPYLFFLGLLIVRGFINGLLQSFLVKDPTVFTNLQEIVLNLIPTLKTMLPYIIISSIIGLFFLAYIRIWYAEFVDRL